MSTADVPASRRATSGSAALWALLWLIVIVAFAATAAEIVRGASAEELEVGQPAPDFGAVDSQGKTRHLGDFKGKTVVLEWTNADCPFTRKHYTSGNMQSLQALARQRSVVWLSIISSAPGKQGYVDGTGAEELTRTRHAMPTAVLLDPSGAVGRLYHAKTTPHMFVIDAQGNLRYMGGIDSLATTEVTDIQTAEPYLKEALLAVVDDKPVAHPVTRPYGCSVKY
jgi:AhpC/TSA family